MAYGKFLSQVKLAFSEGGGGGKGELERRKSYKQNSYSCTSVCPSVLLCYLPWFICWVQYWRKYLTDFHEISGRSRRWMYTQH
jgi:hypothetical protein